MSELRGPNPARTTQSVTPQHAQVEDFASSMGIGGSCGNFGSLPGEGSFWSYLNHLDDHGGRETTS